MASLIAIEGRTYPAVDALDNTEMNLLQRQVLNRNGEISYGNTFLQDLFQDHAGLIHAACRVAKEMLGNIAYRGMMAGDNELGVSLIRPCMVKRTTGGTETPSGDWTFSFAAGSDYWLGFGTDNTTALNIDKRLLVVPMAVWWSQGGAPVVEELQFRVGQNVYPYQVIRHGWIADNQNRVRAARIRPMIWAPKDTVLSQVSSLVANDQEMVLVGLAFAKGDYLSTRLPTSVQT